MKQQLQSPESEERPSSGTQPSLIRPHSELFFRKLTAGYRAGGGQKCVAENVPVSSVFETRRVASFAPV